MTWAGFLDDTVQPRWAAQMEARIDKRLDALMTAVSVQQEDLDALAASLQAIKTNIAAELATLEAEVAAGNIPAGSLDGLTAAVGELQTLETPATG